MHIYILELGGCMSKSMGTEPQCWLPWCKDEDLIYVYIYKIHSRDLLKKWMDIYIYMLTRDLFIHFFFVKEEKDSPFSNTC